MAAKAQNIIVTTKNEWKSEVVLQKIAQFYYRDCHLITQVIHLLFLWSYHGTIWEQQTHWESAFLLKISGSAYSVVNLNKMIKVDISSEYINTL